MEHYTIIRRIKQRVILIKMDDSKKKKVISEYIEITNFWKIKDEFVYIIYTPHMHIQKVLGGHISNC